MEFFGAAAAFIIAMIVYVLIKAARDPFDLPYDNAGDDDPYLVASARTVLTAQPEPLSGAEHEPMGV